MKKLKRITAAAVALATVVLLTVHAGAATTYEYEGYSYTFINNNNISISGWDDRSDELVIPDTINDRNVYSIANYACYNDNVITKLDLSNVTHLSRIGVGAFQGCSGIDQELVLPKCVTSINMCAFQDCSSLPAVIDNSSVTAIPDQCFYSCTALQNIILNANVSSIGYYAFAGCETLEYVELSRNVTSIQASSFQNCPELTLGVYYDSYAYTYARNYEIPYVLLDGVMLGDANGDYSVNVNDVTAVQRHVAELEELEGIYCHAADINGDGVVDIDDATELQLYLAEYDTEYNIGQVMMQ